MVNLARRESNNLVCFLYPEPKLNVRKGKMSKNRDVMELCLPV